MNKNEFITTIKLRTKNLAIDVIKWYDNVKKTDSIRILGKQLIRSSTSVASNYRAACVARSRKEFYSKISIVVEEADESLFWIEMIEETQKIDKAIFIKLKTEALEISKIVAKSRKTARNNFD